MKKSIITLLLVSAAVMLSSCVIIHPEDEDNPFCHKKETKTTEVTNTTTETNQTSVTPNGRYSIKFINRSNNCTVTEWFVRKDRTQTYSNDGYCHPIYTNDYDIISDLPSGEYRIWFMISDEYCFRSEHINLDRDVTYVLITCSTSGYQAEQCRAAVSSDIPQFYLEGSDGSIINVELQ